MWLHRVPRSDNCLGNCPFASPARMFGTRREKNVSSLICNDAVTWSVRGVLQRRMDLPGVGGGRVTSGSPLFFGFFSLPTHSTASQHLPSLPFPSLAADLHHPLLQKPIPKDCRCTTPACGASPCITGPDYCDMGVTICRAQIFGSLHTCR
jgi:hypothetical protein